MTNYRVYCLDGAGHIDSAESISADNDAVAITMATQMKVGGTKCEVWEGRRLVAELGRDQLAG